MDTVIATTPIREVQDFTITLNWQAMNVTFHPYCFADYGHIEFESPHTPPRSIPVSETGYWSHFAPMHEIQAFGDIELFIRELASTFLRAEPQDAKQLTLF